jgi:hypothetical protein
MRGATVNRRAAALGLLLGALRQPAQAQQAAAAQAPSPPAEVAAALPDARWRGSAVMRFFGLHIYDARLWSAAPLAGDGAAQPLALELIYARSLVGEQIASRSIKEMQGIGVVSKPVTASLACRRPARAPASSSTAACAARWPMPTSRGCSLVSGCRPKRPSPACASNCWVARPDSTAHESAPP